MEIEKKAMWDSEAGMRKREKRKLQAGDREDKEHEEWGRTMRRTLGGKKQRKYLEEDDEEL